eukprot:CAMPEP_0194037316 /NCGR_PEP_ID=MMETSP0009_2-20130614/9655_1 /TAXON_ID=210454 /ORGANISM="Grammatophora oceanica, Strain CCMP 410" /LENGTH=36 /DNA_ID= /DNA_START= /DNA_END= /DNA_ORIENTATION=
MSGSFLEHAPMDKNNRAVFTELAEEENGGDSTTSSS